VRIPPESLGLQLSLNLRFLGLDIGNAEIIRKGGGRVTLDTLREDSAGNAGLSSPQ
jgi:hypothetical protein